MMTALKPKKLRLDKNFRPCPKDDGDEFFPNGTFHCNITKLLAHIRSNLEQFPVEEAEVCFVRSGFAKTLDEATIENANLAAPIILAEISPGRFNVIDGHHRLERAFRENREKIPAYRVTAPYHVAFLSSEFEYKKYIEYWNSKVDEL